MRPTALNKRGNKVKMDGYTFDSSKEAYFYQAFVKPSGYDFEVHPRLQLAKCSSLGPKAKVSSMGYTPDFIIKDEEGRWLHVYDVKNSFGIYGIDASVKLRFKLFAVKYQHPVEAVVVRKYDFKVITQGVTKPLHGKEALVKTGFDYSWLEATNYKQEA